MAVRTTLMLQPLCFPQPVEVLEIMSPGHRASVVMLGYCRHLRMLCPSQPEVEVEVEAVASQQMFTFCKQRAPWHRDDGHLHIIRKYNRHYSSSDFFFGLMTKLRILIIFTSILGTGFLIRVHQYLSVYRYSTWIWCIIISTVETKTSFIIIQLHNVSFIM